MSRFVGAGKKVMSFLVPKPKVNKTKLDKLKSEFAIARQERKGAEAKLKQTQFEIENPDFAKGKFTFKKDKGKSESNREAYKRIQKENTKALKAMVDEAFKDKKAKGGRVGLKFGSKKSNVQKIQETFGPKKKVPNKFKGFSKLPEKVQQKIDAKLAKKV